MTKDISIIIPAAAISGIKSCLNKSLIGLTEKQTVIEYQQHILRREFPSAELIFVVGHDADKIMAKLKPGSIAVENENHATTNVVRSIGMGLRATTKQDVMIVYGDLIFNAAALRLGDNSCVAIDKHARLRSTEVGVTVVDGRATQLAYGLKTKWAQILFLTGRELESFKGIVWDRKHSRWFGFEAINELIEDVGPLRAVEPRNMLLVEIDEFKDIEKARKIL